ncbi:MAG TPA: AAA family ATPase [Oscillospiraceae bacterium]|nr:AAA family ATPase [Oscillospiraceae bacterium]
MAEYKCICCDEIKDSDKDCSCSTCGYKMFPTPYDRKDTLTREIKNFLAKFQVRKIEKSDISFHRLVLKKKQTEEAKEEQFDIVPKAKDDQRFPSFSKIQKNVYKADKTEKFIERLQSSLKQIRKHLHTPFKMDYKTDFAALKYRMSGLETVWVNALSELDIAIELPELTMPEIELDYSEIPDEDLLGLADELLDLLERLSTKIHKFIKHNNIYGKAYKQKPKNRFKLSERNTDYGADLEKGIKSVEASLNKKYVVDILSDGSDELGEMLRTLWNAVAILLTLPILKQTRRYQFEDGTVVFGDDIEIKIIDIIGERYAEIGALISSETFLTGKDEDELFKLYNKMIEVDYFGFMGINKSDLEPPGEHEAKLNTLIGLSTIKDSVTKIKAYALANKDSDALNIHMCFYGNPGTGKTEVARIIAGILYENKILPHNHVIEVDRSELVGQYVGETPQKTLRKIRESMGGVLFIDEAYSLIPKDRGFDYGHEAVAALVKAMEDYRGKFCVILAGYKNQMLDMIAYNPGFKSRIQFVLDFPNFTRDELKRITELMLMQRKYTISDVAMDRVLDITDVKRKEPNFANAREIRNILDQVIMCQNLRNAGTYDKELAIVDVNRYIQDSKINLPTSGGGRVKKILSGDEELEQLIGLASVKRMIKKIKAYAKKNLQHKDLNMHMCFYGNPGTGKTEVARILSRILYEAGVLPEAKLIETTPHGLIGQYVGSTAPKTQAKIQDAMGGVLFIDEAYGLVSGAAEDGFATGYGEEAIAVLLKKMEDHRGQFCAILAGYREEMKTMLGTNPGLESRIQFTLEFPDYTREELREIALTFLEKQKYQIELGALDRLLDITEYFRDRPNFANARTVRNILDQVIMNQNLRTEDITDDSMVIIDDVEDYLTDEGIDLTDKKTSKLQMGFVCD